MLRQIGVFVATSSTTCRHDIRSFADFPTLHGAILLENRLLLPAENRFVASNSVSTEKHICEKRLFIAWIIDLLLNRHIFRPIFRRIGQRGPNWHETEGTDPRETGGGQTLKRRRGQTLRQTGLPFHNTPERALPLMAIQIHKMTYTQN